MKVEMTLKDIEDPTNTIKFESAGEKKVKITIGINSVVVDGAEVSKAARECRSGKE